MDAMENSNQQLVAIVVLLLTLTGCFSGEEKCRPATCVCDHKTLSCNSSSLHVVPPSGIKAETTVLHLFNNSVLAIQDNSFHTLVNLSTLDISSNKIHAISNNAFRNLKKLTTLNLNGNSVDTLDYYLISDLSNLEILMMKTNKLKVVGQHSLDELKLLKHLDLSINHIHFIHPHAFTHLKKLKVLELEGNSLTIASPKWFTSFKLTSLTLTENLWKCNCSMKPYLAWFHNYTGNFTQPHVKRSLNVFCRLQHNHIKNLAEKDLNCSTVQISKSKITKASPTTSTSPTVSTAKKNRNITFPPTKEPVNRPNIKKPVETIKVTSNNPIVGMVNKSVEQGKVAILHCAISGASWHKDGNILKTAHMKHRYTLRNKKLIIKASKKADKGTYCCSKTSAKGNAKQCLALTITSNPDATKTAVPGASGVSPAVVALIVLAAIVVFIGIGAFCVKRTKQLRRERYGLLNDRRVFDPVNSDVTMKPPRSNTGVSEDYV